MTPTRRTKARLIEIILKVNPLFLVSILTTMPGLNMVNDVTSVSLVTSSLKETAQYHLLELTPGMVALFESNKEEDRQRRGIKRSREGDEDDDDDQERDFQ